MAGRVGILSMSAEQVIYAYCDSTVKVPQNNFWCFLVLHSFGSCHGAHVYDCIGGFRTDRWLNF